MIDYSIGELAEKYETGGRGPGYISDGDKWDPGGDSYGSYQLATKVGTLEGYLKTNLPYVAELNQCLPIKSTAFNTRWKLIAATDPTGFKQSQFDYVETLSYLPCRKYADKIGLKDTFAINSALFSTSNQSGGWQKILDGTNINYTDSEVTQINKLYDSRANYFSKLSSLSPDIRNNIIKARTVEERADCLKLMDNQPVKEPANPPISIPESPPVSKPDGQVKTSALQSLLDFLNKLLTGGSK